jgi:cytochrome c peroxidase
MNRIELGVGALILGLTASVAACAADAETAVDPPPVNVDATRTSGAGDRHTGAAAAGLLPNDVPIANGSGAAATHSTTGSVDLSGPFFQSLGTNGRSCGTCHAPTDGWTVVPEHLRERFDSTDGTDPIFRTNDGSNSPTADVSTVEKRRAAYSMLLTKGLIRVSNPVPAGADYTLVAVDDPYQHATAADLSTFRRPLPSANLDALSTVMWDGRETQTTVASDPDLMGCSLAPTAPRCWKTIATDLKTQSNDATLGHAQSVLGLVPAQQDAIVAFERALFFGQIFDADAKELTVFGAQGGPAKIASRAFYFGENDVLSGDYRTHAPFTTKVFDEYDAWANVLGDGVTEAARRAVARGQELFNSKPIAIAGVKGINDDFGIPVLAGTCTSCHDTPHGGNHSIPAPLDIGLTGDHPEALARTADLPLYTFARKSDGATFVTTDPGRGLISGKFKDLGRFKGPVLRGVAARPPYFHNGSATTSTCGGRNRSGSQPVIAGRASAGCRAMSDCRIAPTRAPAASRSPAPSMLHLPPWIVTSTYATAAAPSSATSNSTSRAPAGPSPASSRFFTIP